MSSMSSMSTPARAELVAPKALDTCHSNVSREIALVDLLNDGAVPWGAAVRVRGADRDKEDMERMGRRQELKRNYRPLSVLSFSLVLTATWEYLLVACTPGLINGGLAGLFWSYVWTFIGFTFVEMSLAEMASMAPASGGQFHWVSEFAPPRYQRFLSYVVGWMSTLSWQAGNAADCYLTGTVAQALLVVNNEAYAPQQWHGVLFVLVMVFSVYAANVWGRNVWSRMQNALMVLHVLAFLAMVIALWCLAPHRTAHDVFTKFTNLGGWSSTGLSSMIGQMSAIYCVLGADATAHMAEEVRDAARYVPLSFFWSYIINSLMGIVVLASFLFAIEDETAALNHSSGYPFLYVFTSTLPLSLTNAFTIILLLLVSAANINFGSSTARQTFAFARDAGLPFSSTLAHIHPSLHVPRNAILLSTVIGIALALLSVASVAALYAAISLQIVSLMFTYAVSISCILHRRITHPELLPRARWSLGRWGVPVNVAALAYVLFAFLWSFWPAVVGGGMYLFNWAPVLFCGVLALCLGMYWGKGRRVYRGPVEKVRRLSGETW